MRFGQSALDYRKWSVFTGERIARGADYGARSNLNESVLAQIRICLD